MGTLRFRLRYWSLLLALALAGCGMRDTGRGTRGPGPASRVVSLIPATTELLYAIGAGDELVGRSVWCTYPEAALSVPAVGDGIVPNVEAIVARHPDLVVLYRSSQNAAAAGRLKQLGIRTMEVRTDLLSDVTRVGRMLGELTGHEAGADSMARAFEDSLRAVTVPRGADPVRVLLVVWSDPPMTVGRGSYITELIERAGGENVYADLPASSAQISVESAVERNPDVILVLGDSTPAFARRPEWQAVPAVRLGHFVRASGTMFGQPSPRAPQAIRLLAAKLDSARLGEFAR
jgi:iron complex transport system substrate-binding protein